MNGIEKIAWRNIKGIFDYEVGGWYNCIQDHCEEYIPDTKEEAFNIIYDEAMNDAAGKGWFKTGKAPREMRFAGEVFIKECIEHLFKVDEDICELAEVKNWV